jgi:hypothetical protein
MELEIDLRRAPAGVRLVDPDDFGSFRVLLVDGACPLEDVLEPAGIARVDEHAWVRIDALRDLAGPHATPDWESSLGAMLEFARTRGWVDDELGAVRGHVVRRESAES